MVLLRLLPTIFTFLLQILIAIILDAILHFFEIGFIGKYLGPIGTAFILASFVYSLRKRRFIKWGALKHYLMFHETATWFGALLILIHSGIHFNALIPWLATSAMLINIASGFTGRYLLGESMKELETQKDSLIKQGLSSQEAEARLMLNSISVKVMEKWRSVHHPITAIFAGLSAFHIFIVFMYGAI